MAWEFVKAGLEGNCTLFGVNIFRHKWERTGEKAEVKDPKYHESHTFNVYKVNVDGNVYTFAAGAFSNGIFGFYMPKNR
jgi:hypothetical protein